MLSTNDYQKRRQSHFAIHKLIIGAMSILLGVAFLASGQTVRADAVKPDSNSKLTTYSGLNSFLKSHDDAETSKANKNDLAPESASNHTNVAQERPTHTVQTQADHIHQGKWNNINVTYNDETKELTLLGDTEDAPAIMQNGDNLEPLYKFLPNVSGDRNTLKKITIQGKIKAQGSARNLFGSIISPWDQKLTSIEGLVNLDTSEITDMSFMFGYCENLTSLDVSHFDTSKVTDMSGMFADCFKLTSLDLSHFDTSQVTDMSSMFYWTRELITLDLSHFDTSKVTRMYEMFDYCQDLASLNVSHFDTSNVTDMSSMFAGCLNLISLDLSHFNTSKVIDMNAMFVYSPLFQLSLGKNFRFLQEQKTGLEDLPGKWINCGVANQQLPKGTKQWTSEDFVKNYNGSTDYDTYIFLADWNNISVSYNDETKELTLWGGTEGAPAIMQNREKLKPLFEFLPQAINFTLKKITIEGGIKAQDSAPDLFSALGNLTSIEGLANLDTSEVTNMRGMFGACDNLTSLDLTHFDTSKVTDMDDMFASDSNLTNLDVSGFNTSNVTDMMDMFGGCYGLTSLDLSRFDTSKVTGMSVMFFGCKNLTSLDLSHFDTSNVTDMSSMFFACENLINLDLSHFDTSKVTDMSYMFWNCPKLRQLSLGKSFKFLPTTNLEDLPGKWINWGVANQQLPKGTKQWSSVDFVKNYNGQTDYDTYVRLANLITIQYRDQNGSKIPDIADEQQYGNVGDSLIDKTNPNSLLSFKRKDIAGYNFDHAEIDGQTVNLTNIKYTDNPQTLTLFYAKTNSDNNGNNDSDNSNESNGANNTNGSNDSNGQNSPNNSNNSSNPGNIKIPVAFTSNVTLRHNAYLYNGNGKRANNVTFKAGSIVTVYGNKNINGRKFYILIDNKKKYYVAVGNVKSISRKLKHNAYIYNKYGQRVKKTGVFKKAKQINTFGDPVTIRGHRYFIIDNGRFVKAANFVLKSSSKTVTTAGIKAGTENKSKAAAKTIMHNAYLYNNQGKRANKVIVLAGSKINTLNLAKIKNRLYYKLEDGLHIAAGNINAARQKLKHNAYIYSQYGNRIGKKVLKKRKFVKTYGDAVGIKHKKYYITAKNKFVKKANFR